MPQQLTAGEGPIVGAEEKAQLTLANSARCRTWLSQGRAKITTVAQAQKHIHFTVPPEPKGEAYTRAELDELYPFVLIGTGADNGFTSRLESMSGSASPFDFRERGTILAHFYQSVPASARTEAEIERRFKNDLGVIIRELFDLFGTAGLLAVRQINLNGPMRNHPDDIPAQDDLQAYELVMDWGRF